MAPSLLLTAGDARAVVLPGVGGSVASFTHRGVDVLRRASAAAIDAADVLGMACYPLVPYSNRIALARLRFGAAEHPLARNFGDHPHSIHGFGWQRPWQVQDQAADRVALVLDHAATGDDARHWPWPLRSEQQLTLIDEGDGEAALVCSLAVVNTGSATFPCGLGWHPFFPRTPATRLAFAARGFWQTDGTGLPTHCTRPEPWGFAAGRDLDGVVLDNVFAGWEGSARLSDPVRGIVTVLGATAPCRHLVVYAPAAGDFIAVEPVSHVTDAFNRAARGDADTGMLSLDPGHRISCTMRISAQLPP
ncbi:MAG: aldose 1-epimerase [Betaproteobacteria bacterium]|nr:aldose 1-epimerase [Betaproteobacteria bacterium]